MKLFGFVISYYLLLFKMEFFFFFAEFFKMEFMSVLFIVIFFWIPNYLGHIPTWYNGKISRYFSYYSKVLHLPLM